MGKGGRYRRSGRRKRLKQCKNAGKLLELTKLPAVFCGGGNLVHLPRQPEIRADTVVVEIKGYDNWGTAGGVWSGDAGAV